MKYFFFFLFFLLHHSVYAQVNISVEWKSNISISHGDTLFYNTGRKLVWPDFKGRPDNKSIAAAVTSSGFGYTCMMKAKNRVMSINISVYCFYDKVQSWVKSGMASDYALLHEQHHFDIAYIATCLFINRLKTTTFKMENYAGKLNKIYDECYDEMEKMQNDYDCQTKNGQLKNIQREWNNKIDGQLASIPID